MKGVKLTENQRKFAEEHHSVLENFLKYRGLSFDEYYDVVVFRFLRAVQQYDEQEELRRYAFETIAKNHMKSALGNHFRKQKQMKQNVMLLSLDYPISESGLTFGDTIVDRSIDICEQVCRKLSRTNRRYRLLHKYSIAPAIRQEQLVEVM